LIYFVYMQIVKIKVDNDPHSKGQRLKSRKKLRDQHLGRKKYDPLSLIYYICTSLNVLVINLNLLQHAAIAGQVLTK